MEICGNCANMKHELKRERMPRQGSCNWEGPGHRARGMVGFYQRACEGGFTRKPDIIRDENPIFPHLFEPHCLQFVPASTLFFRRDLAEQIGNKQGFDNVLAEFRRRKEAKLKEKAPNDRFNPEELATLGNGALSFRERLAWDISDLDGYINVLNEMEYRKGN